LGQLRDTVDQKVGTALRLQPSSTELWNADAIERQPAHVETNDVGRAYPYSDH
jgi:hypothetical protein